MKRKIFTVATITAVSCSLLFSSCIGSFGLSNKLLAWNQNIDNKFVNAIIFFVLTPAYAVTLTGDALIFNSIEFWTGENPIEAGTIKTVQGENGIYTVETLKDGYNITDEAGQESQFIYDKTTKTWSLVKDEQSTKLITIEDNNQAIVYLPNGETKNVELSNEGILAVRQAVQNDVYLAAR